jgi:type IV pilus assembly protein PilW
MIVQRQLGMSLIELMISLVVGLFIIAGVAQVFLGGRAAYNLQQNIGDLQENGRFALYFLQRDIRMAGFPKNAVPVIDVFNRGPTGTTNTLTFDGGGVVSDQITVSYQGNGRDCLGQAVAGIVVNTFYIDTNRLMCRGNGNAQGQPMVDGIRNMQILYGEDMDANGYADRYVQAGQVTNWVNVVAVRVGVLATAVNAVIGDTAAPTFQVLDVAGVGPLPAGIRGRVFRTTIEVRNRTQ